MYSYLKWENFKIFIPSFLRYFDWNHAFNYVNKFSVLKMNFLLNIDTYFMPVFNLKNSHLYFSGKVVPYHPS